MKLTIRRPDDWHVHFRDGDMLAAVAPYTARQFARAIVMPNLDPPVTTVAAARAYRDRILAAAPGFTPLMTCYLTDDCNPSEIRAGFEQGVFTAAKLYPANATTNSAYGVTAIRNIHPVLDEGPPASQRATGAAEDRLGAVRDGQGRAILQRHGTGKRQVILAADLRGAC